MGWHTGFWYTSHRRAAKMCAYTGYGNRESPAQFQNRIKPRMDVNVRHITRSTVWENSIMLAQTGLRKISSVACGFSRIKIHQFKFNQ